MSTTPACDLCGYQPTSQRDAYLHEANKHTHAGQRVADVSDHTQRAPSRQARTKRAPSRQHREDGAKLMVAGGGLMLGGCLLAVIGFLSPALLIFFAFGAL
jgi:ferric-dicitrate binding protein FerR (iron transport regulator)